MSLCCDGKSVWLRTRQDMQSFCSTELCVFGQSAVGLLKIASTVTPLLLEALQWQGIASVGSVGVKEAVFLDLLPVVFRILVLRCLLQLVPRPSGAPQRPFFTPRSSFA